MCWIWLLYMQLVSNHISLLPLILLLNQEWHIFSLLKVYFIWATCFRDMTLQPDLFLVRAFGLTTQWEDSLYSASTQCFLIWFLVFWAVETISCRLIYFSFSETLNWIILDTRMHHYESWPFLLSWHTVIQGYFQVEIQLYIDMANKTGVSSISPALLMRYL